MMLCTQEQSSSAPVNWSEEHDYRKSFGRFPTGVTVITTCTPEGRPIGMTVNSFSSVSMDPPMILWSLQTSSKSRDFYRYAECFAVHILSAPQEDVSRVFCSRLEDRFEGLDWEKGAGGAPILKGCSAVIECKRGEVVTWGDHDVISGLVLRHAYTDDAPLAFLAGRYGLFSETNGRS